MPELPEVETVRRGLTPTMVGARIDRVEMRRPDLRFPFPEQFVERLTGRTILALRRRANRNSKFRASATCSRPTHGAADPCRRSRSWVTSRSAAA